RGLHADLVRPNAIHFVEQSFAFAIQFALDAQRWKAVRHHANAPAGSIRAAAISSVDQNFGWRFGLRAWAEGTILRAVDDHAVAEKIHRASSAFGGDDHPSARDGILSQLRHSNPPRSFSGTRNRYRTKLADCTASQRAAYARHWLRGGVVARA